jgi:hypothetical protein
MEDQKKSIIESYRKELSAIHPSLPAYFYATTGYIIPWNRTPSGEELINRFLLERVDPNGEIDDEVLDELVRIWVSESWYGLAVHPPLAFMLLKRQLKDPNSKLSRLLYKDGFPSEIARQNENTQSAEEVLQNIVNMQAESGDKKETKSRGRRKV